MERGHIGFAEAVVLTFVMLSSKVLFPYPSLVVQTGQTAGWLVVLVSTALAGVGFLILAALVERYPGRGLPEISQEVAGNLAGNLLNLLLVAWLVLDAALVLRLAIENFVVALLPRTPPSALMALGLALCIYAGWLGLEAISRANLVIGPFLTVALLAVLLFNLPEAQLGLLMPVLGPGPGPVLAAGLADVGFMSEVALLGIYAYALRGRRTLRRAGLITLLLAGVALAAAVALYIGVFGPEAAGRQPFPFYNLSRMVYLGRFVQRVEAFFVLFWIIAAVIRVSVYLHAAAVTVATTLGVPHFRPLLLPLATMIFALALVPEDFTTAVLLNTLLRRWEALPVFIIPLLLLLPAARRRPEVDAHAD